MDCRGEVEIDLLMERLVGLSGDEDRLTRLAGFVFIPGAKLSV